MYRLGRNRACKTRHAEWIVARIGVCYCQFSPTRAGIEVNKAALLALNDSKFAWRAIIRVPHAIDTICLYAATQITNNAFHLASTLLHQLRIFIAQGLETLTKNRDVKLPDGIASIAHNLFVESRIAEQTPTKFKSRFDIPAVA